MLTRTAIYEGTIQDGREDEFFRRVRDELMPIWRDFPGLLSMRVQRRVSADTSARPIPMILEMDFADQAAIDALSSSPVRERAHAATLEVMKLFDGDLYHLVSEAL